ncbi:high mobility group protein [Microsporum ferrugineum]
MPARSRATTPGPGRGRTETPGPAHEAPLDLVQSINLLTYRINSTAQDLFLGAQQPELFPPTLTCEQVIVGLAALQSAVSDLSRAYINHANTVLNRGPSNIDIGGLNSLLENGIFQPNAAGAVDGDAGAATAGTAGAAAEAGTVRAPSPGARSVAGTKRKRVHDPNAPKRALTAYFLYMKHERANIAAELGTNARPKEVADEGTRRWSEMSDAERQKWKQLYAENLAVYKEQMSAYKASLPPGHKVDTTVPATPKPAKAAKTSKTSKTSTKTARQEDDHDAAAEQQLQMAVHEATTEDTSSDSDSSNNDSPAATPTPSPPKPTPKSQKRRQSKAAAAAAAAPAPAPVIETPTPATKKPSPEKKKSDKGKSKDKDRRASVAATVAAASPQEPPKSEKKTRKKRKSGVDEF